MRFQPQPLDPGLAAVFQLCQRSRVSDGLWEHEVFVPLTTDRSWYACDRDFDCMCVFLPHECDYQ